MPVVRSPCWYLGAGFDSAVVHDMPNAYCVWKNSCSSGFLPFESETSRRVTVCPLGNSNELLGRIVSTEDSADEASA